MMAYNYIYIFIHIPIRRSMSRAFTKMDVVVIPPSGDRLGPTHIIVKYFSII